MVRKYFYLCSAVTVMACMLMASAAWAAEAMPLGLVVIDKDLKGTNVRATPHKNGAIVVALPPTKPGGNHQDNSLDLLRIHGYSMEKGWIKVTVFDGGGKDKDVQGYMHTSVLGTCAGATEEGAATWYSKPSEESKDLGLLKQGEALQVLSMQGRWVQVRRVTGDKRKGGTGWVMSHALAGSISELEECLVAWERSKI